MLFGLAWSGPALFGSVRFGSVPSGPRAILPAGANLPGATPAKQSAINCTHASVGDFHRSQYTVFIQCGSVYFRGRVIFQPDPYSSNPHVHPETP